MTNLGGQIAGGAAWMVGLRFSQRGIGLVSTVILARLLVPEDFGLVAMAMAIYALVELFAEFSFDIALIQNQQAERRHYDTAWTFNVLFRGASAFILVVTAPWISQGFGDPRLEAIIYVIAFVAVIQGLQNIGVVAFRKDFRFNMEFLFRISRKLIAFVVTVGLAFWLRNYWALVFGILASHLGATVLSYLLHPYRPRLSLSATRELFGFSGWVFVNSLFRYATERGPDLLIGRLAGSAGLGLYRIAYEIATLPTTELYAPIMRAVFPGFSKISHDLARLREAYTSVQGVVVTVTAPAGITIVVLAEPLVHLLLGTKWLAAIPMIRIIGLFGVVHILHGNRFSLLMALGQPYWVAAMNFLQGTIILALMGLWLSLGHGVTTAAWALVVSALATLPLGMALVTWKISLSPWQFVAVQLRPVVATILMAAVMWRTSEALPPVEGLGDAALHLGVAGAAGTVTYVTALAALWHVAGRPVGAEVRVLEMTRLDRVLRPRTRQAR